ncbi:speckle-type POZ protein-like B [Daphnia pulex]|uniref:speckle-type POZ protein-like B n=1 Tax=Daphnia pulex TaxID=6669 RepID=UPI001EDDC279|nr:speckle-type POZ protein-like B [Daphnia pulex]
MASPSKIQSQIERNVIKTMGGFASMFHDQHRCDVQFHFKDGKSIGAHILILSISSPVFSAMFQSGLLESQTREVNIIDTELDIFWQLLDYLYTGSAPKLSDENIAKLLFEAADKYAVENLKSECLEALQERVRLDNVVNLMVWSDFRSIKSVFDVALEFTVNNFRKLIVQADFEDFLKSYPDLCLMVMKRVALLIPCQCDPNQPEDEESGDEEEEDKEDEEEDEEDEEEDEDDEAADDDFDVVSLAADDDSDESD